MQRGHRLQHADLRGAYPAPALRRARSLPAEAVSIEEHRAASFQALGDLAGWLSSVLPRLPARNPFRLGTDAGVT